MIPAHPITIVPSQVLPEGRSGRFVGSVCLRINVPAISWSNAVGGCWSLVTWQRGLGEERHAAPNIAPLGCAVTELQCNW